MPSPASGRVVLVSMAFLLLTSRSAQAEDHDEYSISANASFAPKVMVAMASLGGVFSYAPDPLYAFGGGIDFFFLASGDCSTACATVPAGGQLITADAELRPKLVGPLGVFVKGSAGIARVTIGTHATTGHEAWATARLSIGPELRGSHLLFRAIVFETVLGRFTSPGFGLDLGATF